MFFKCLNWYLEFFFGGFKLFKCIAGASTKDAIKIDDTMISLWICYEIVQRCVQEPQNWWELKTFKFISEENCYEINGIAQKIFHRGYWVHFHKCLTLEKNIK